MQMTVEQRILPGRPKPLHAALWTRRGAVDKESLACCHSGGRRCTGAAGCASQKKWGTARQTLMRNKIFHTIYFGVQRGRGGVSRAMVREASALLDSPSEQWKDHIIGRLREVHGSQASWAWLHDQPLVDRENLLKSAREAASHLARPHSVEIRKTSGSTGTPFVFAKSKRMTAWMDAAMWAVYDWYGVRPGLPHARFWGTPINTSKQIKTRVSDWLLHRRRIGAFSLSLEEVIHQFERLREFRPFYAYGYPTLMRAFVELCRRRNLDGQELGIRVVISTGEILSDTTRNELSTFFGCPVVNEYGCTESGILAFQCSAGGMHAIPVAAWTEVVDASGNLKGPTEEGEIVVSDLFGSSMPLLRYRLHDRGTAGSVLCDCGRDLPSLQIASGRSDSFIRTPTRIIYNAILAYTVPPEVQRFKVIQTSLRHLEAQILPGSDFDPKTTPDECRRRWEKALGPGVQVTVRTVESIPLEPSGKLRYFIPLDGEHSAL